MGKVQQLTQYGLFDARVPRYTSYPPANRFTPDMGQIHQSEWLAAVPADRPISVYVHIPFCRRLCWFCACRTQGTKIMDHVDTYIDHVIRELHLVARHMSPHQRIERLHLGGGTPTILSASVMDKLLNAIFDTFQAKPTLEFSVEVDPTDADPDVLHCLSTWNMNRASIGVQDFDPKVQQAIGRHQSYDQTAQVIETLRGHGVPSVNLDLLYGLPHQTQHSLQRTLDLVTGLNPDRLALYGYAHVPHMSKRQVMINAADLPQPIERYALAEQADADLRAKGFLPIGIDHYAKATDSLARAAMQHRMYRNFQGYTDDPCETLIGLGASAISKFSQGYVQNAPATAAYARAVQSGQLAGQKGYEMRGTDHLIAEMLSQIMCYGYLDTIDLTLKFPTSEELISKTCFNLVHTFENVMIWEGPRAVILPQMRSLTRIIAAHLDTGAASGTHSQAI